jgi:hypothetical protein
MFFGHLNSAVFSNIKNKKQNTQKISNYATDNGLKCLGNSTEEKVIQETLIYDTGKFVFTLR